MCGIAGLVTRARIEAAPLRRMADSIAHRGPDDDGIWLDPEAGVGFGHRRLSIVDLSPAGHQPMASRDGRWTISYNGEIYNHAELRAELDSTIDGPWRGHSDTETLVEAISAWGLERALERAVGMFAISLWDAREQRLHLIRDRFGEKPLYYGWVGGDFAFASELKALRTLPGFDNAIDRRSVGLYARLGYIPAPHSVYEQVHKLEPGCILSGTPSELLARERLVRPYWSYRDVVRAGLDAPIADEREAAEALEAALLESVRGQAMADVPVGAFLSGGVDSSTVVALYRQVSDVRTFTIGFEDAAFDEAPHARAVAELLGTRHHEAYVTAREAREIIPLLPRIYDEPFADSSQIPTYLVCRHARRQVKVALSGDGGDELFGGYNRHLVAAGAWAKARRLPAPMRAAAGAALGLVPASAWDLAADLLGRRSRQPHFGTKVRKALRTIGRARDVDALYDSFVDEWHGEASPVAGAGGLERPEPLDGAAPDAVRMMYRDGTEYLPGDLLHKVDRAAMAVSLETRLPLLDHRVAALAARIPVELKLSGGVGKQLLRRVLGRHVPAELFARPKAGFAVPVGEWLKGPLREWAEGLLDDKALRESGWFDGERVRARWRDHLSGRREATAALWSVLMFQAWLAEPSGAAAEASKFPDDARAAAR